MTEKIPRKEKGSGNENKEGVNRRQVLGVAGAIAGAAALGTVAAVPVYLRKQERDKEIEGSIEEMVTKITRKEQAQFGPVKGPGVIFVEIKGKEVGFDVSKNDFELYEQGDAVRVRFGTTQGKPVVGGIEKVQN